MSDRIEQSDVESLQRAYGTLLEKRNDMLKGLAVLDESPFDRELLVDSLIMGLMRHLHDVAANPDIFAERINRNGGDFSNYSYGAAADMSTIVASIAKLDPNTLASRRSPTRSAGD